MSGEGERAVRVLRTIEEIEAVRADWERLQWHPGSDLDRFLEELRRERGLLLPHVVVLECAGRVEALLAAAVRDEHLAWRVGSFSIWRSRARCLRVDTGGLMGCTDAEGAALLVAHLADSLARGEAQVAYLHQLPAGAEIVTALGRLPRLMRDPFPKHTGGGGIDLPGSWEEYRAGLSKSVRKNLNYYANKLRREYGEGLEVVEYRDPADLDALVRECEAVAEKTYHRGLGVGFKDDPATRERLRELLAAGWQRVWVLRRDGRPVAFWSGVKYRGTLYTGDTGFDPDEGKLRPGTFLLAHLIEQQSRDPEVTRIDFGVMEAEYKRIFGNLDLRWVSTYVFSRRPKGIWLAGWRLTTGSLDRAARRLLGGGRLRRWARRIASRRR